MSDIDTTDNAPDDPGWRFYIPVDVRFEDIDMFDHVNNAKYLTYIESARVAYYTAITGIQDPREFGAGCAIWAASD